jgi:hypothetical protein
MLLALIAAVSAFSYWLGAERRAGVQPWSTHTGDESPHIGPLTPVDRQHLRSQRELADDLARRHVGLSLSAQLPDLRTLQELIDLEVIAKQETYALQALGVALGDVLVGEHPVTWVHVSDEYGESRALRIGDTDELVFPLTMLSRRIEAGIPVDIQALFGKADNTIARSLRRASLRRGGR